MSAGQAGGLISFYRAFLLTPLKEGPDLAEALICKQNV
jgi:hypothetical protein